MWLWSRRKSAQSDEERREGKLQPPSKCLPRPSAALHAAPDSVTYHGDLQGIDVERVNLPVAANVVDKFDESVDPENPSYHQDADEEAVCLDSASKKRQVVGYRPRQEP